MELHPFRIILHPISTVLLQYLIPTNCVSCHVHYIQETIKIKNILITWCVDMKRIRIMRRFWYFIWFCGGQWNLFSYSFVMVNCFYNNLLEHYGFRQMLCFFRTTSNGRKRRSRNTRWRNLKWNIKKSINTREDNVFIIFICTCLEFFHKGIFKII